MESGKKQSIHNNLIEGIVQFETHFGHRPSVIILPPYRYTELRRYFENLLLNNYIPMTFDKSSFPPHRELHGIPILLNPLISYTEFK